MARYYSNANDLITFSRASTATFIGSDGLIQTASVDGPRIDYDPLTGKVKGLLIEEERENLVTYSEDFSNAAWGKFGGGVIVADAATSPDGTSNASQFYGSDGAHVIEDTSATAGTTYTYSVFVKTNGTADLTVAINFRSSGGSINYFGVDIDTTTGAVSAPALGLQSTSSNVQDVGNGWFRLSISHEAPATTITARAYMANRTGAAASSSDGYLIYGAQLEEGSFPTSYIPTSGSTVTRSADIASIPVSAFGYNQDAGTVVVGVDNIKAGISQRVLSINNSANSVNDRIDLLKTGNENIQNYTLDGGSLQADHVVSVVGLTSFTVAAAFAPDDYSMCVNGGSVVSEDQGTPTVPAVDNLKIGSGVFSSNLNGHIKSLKYYPRRLTDAQLQKLTG